MNLPHAEHLERAKELHREALVLDSHCDTTQFLAGGKRDLNSRNRAGHVDIPRLREGGVDAAVFAVWAPEPKEPGEGPKSAREQIRQIREAHDRYGDDLEPARTLDDIRRAKEKGRIAVPFAIEGGHLIEDSLDLLREFHDAGAIYLTLTHGSHTGWADSAGIHEPIEPLHGGLTGFGRDVIRELNRIGMMIDISHVSDATFWDVLETSDSPVVATHSSCRAISNHRRNLSDEMMLAIARSGGVVQINFCAGFIDPDFPVPDPDALTRYWESGGAIPVTDHVTPLGLLVDHFDHALKLIGPQHVGIGSDFDGVAALPADMEDCSKLPNLTAALLERGHPDVDLRHLLGESFLRVMDVCQKG